MEGVVRTAVSFFSKISTAKATVVIFEKATVLICLG